MLEVIADTFPTSDIVVPWNNAPWRHITPRVTESFLARTSVRDRKALAAVALPAVWRTVVDKRKQVCTSEEPLNRSSMIGPGRL